MSSSDDDSQPDDSPRGEADWDNEGEEMDAEPTRCLFCPTESPSVRECLAHCIATHDCDILQLRKDMGA